MQEIIFHDDPYQMNWLRTDYVYGEVSCPKELSGQSKSHREGDLVFTEICITNPGDKPVFTTVDSIAIAFPLEDKYEGSDVCMTSRCHTHIFCGENISYIMALRMGGAAPHFGMALMDGSLSHYSVKRDLSKMSNDRGCFYLHPSPMEFAPKESKVIRWVIFPHRGRDDFKRQMGKYCRYVDVQAERYVLFPGEKNKITVRPSFQAHTVKINGKAAMGSEGTFFVEDIAAEPGEQIYRVEVDGIHTWCRTYVHIEPEQLLKRRCLFIAKKQQYHGKITELSGAYLLYDNEEGHMVYRPVNDYNGGRERVCMGILIARYLRKGCPDKEQKKMLEDSLQQYIDYILRELLDPDTGRVFNDIGRDLGYMRNYNFPWFATFFVELYYQYGKKEYLQYAYRIIKCFYGDGGAKFYPIDLPVFMISEALEKAGMSAEREELLGYFTTHAKNLMETGCHYPTSELNYEQSIVAPAADLLLQVYLLTREREYLEAAKIQIGILDLFNGEQPDYHLHEVAIRHWDGYWFGKYQLYGDTFPHYWSALTGNVFALYARVTGDLEYARRAEDSRRAVLPMIFPDGSASCAYLYPRSINGIRGGFYDPYANDQDWGLYFYIRAKMEESV